MSRISSIRLGWLAILLSLFVATAHAQVRPCVVGTPGAPTIEQLSTLEPGENNTVGVDLNEYAVILQDISSLLKDENDRYKCDTPELRNAFTKRLEAQIAPPRNGFRGFLHGGSMSFAYLTGLILGSRGELTPRMDELLRSMPFDPSIGGCGHTNGRWKLADDCMDEFTVASEGYAWRWAYLNRSNRPSNDRSDALHWVRESLLNFDRSLCIYDQTVATIEDDSPIGPCNGTIEQLKASLGDDTRTVLLPLNHQMEDANYGIGLVTTLANTYLALDVGGDDVSNADFGDRADDVLTIYKALWLQGQRSAGPEPGAEPPPGQEHDFNALVAAALRAWNPAGCYRPVPDNTPFEGADFDFRDRPCWDQQNVTYRITTYPVAAFYDEYVGGYRGDPNKFQFGTDSFVQEKFFNASGAFKDPLGFFGVARYLIYYTLTHEWLVNPQSRPELGGFTPPTCSSVPAPTATVSGGGFVGSEPGRISVRFTGGGPWTITWSDGHVDEDILFPELVRNVPVTDANENTTYSITSVRGGGCTGTATGSAKFTIRRSQLFVENVNASAGVPDVYRVTLTSNAGPIADQDVHFTILGQSAGTARTDSHGRASITYTVDVPPQSYPNEIKVSYSGPAGTPATGSASLHVACDVPAFTVEPEAVNFTRDGGSVEITITTSEHCDWSAAVVGNPPPTWLRVQRTTDTTFRIIVDPMATNEPTRTARVFAGFRHVSVQQSQVCNAQFSPSLVYIPASGPILPPPNPAVTDVTTLEVSVPGSCPWTVTSDDDWLHLVKPNEHADNDPMTNDTWVHTPSLSGVGTGTIKFRADNNSSTSRRRGRLTVVSDDNTSKASINQYGKPVCRAPEILAEPVDGSVLNGQNIAMRVYATGTELRYTWHASGELFGVNAGPVVFLRPGHSWYPGPGSGKVYSVTVHNECGSDSAQAVWSVSPTSTACKPPFINDNPDAENSPFPGARVRLSVSAEHWEGDPSEPLHYQWYAGMTGQRTAPIGEDKPFVDVRPHETSFYWVEVRDSCGKQNSGTGVVVTTLPPKMRAVGHDFTGDGQSDVVWHNPTTGVNELWWMQSTTKLQALPMSTNSDRKARVQSIGDFDGDERPDLVWRNPETGQNSVWLMNGRHLGTVKTLESRPGGQWSIGAVADLDFDEQHDIVWHNDATGENEIWFQSGTQHTGTFALPSSPDPNWGLHGTGDFTRDGKPDLFFHNSVTGQSSIWVMNDEKVASVNAEGSAPVRRPRFRATVHAIGTQDPNWKPAMVADMNGDSNPDIVWRNSVTGDNSVWIMSGMTRISTQTMTPQPDLSWEVGGGGSTNSDGGTGTGTDTRTSTSMTVTATTAPFGKATTITATLTSSDGTPLANRTIVFLLDQAEVARLITNGSGVATAGVSVAAFAAGTHPGAIAVKFEGDVQYAASTASTALVVAPPLPVITWPAPAPIAYGTPLSATQLNATANVPGSFTYSHAPGAILNAGFHALTATFTPADASLQTVAKTNVLVVTKGPVSLTWPAPAPIAYGTPLGSAQLNAAANTAGAFVYDPPAGTILTVGTHTLGVTFIPSSSDNYDTTSATTTITVIQGAQTISWATPTPIVYGTPLSAAQLNASVSTSGSAPAGALTYSPAAGAILNAGTYTLTVTAAATQFYAAASASVQLVVTPATPSLTWPAPAPIVYGTPLSATQLNAAANAAGFFTYSPAAGAILNAGTHTLSVTFTSSDPNYTSASKSVPIAVVKATPVLTWAAPAAITYGTPLYGAQLNATANVGGTFTYTPSSGTILDAGTRTLNVQFTPADANNYEPGSASATLVVNRAKQTITWSAPSPIVYGTPLSATQLNATASVVGPSPAGALTYTPAAGTILQAGPAQVLTVSAAATANYDPAAASVTIDVLKAKPVLTWPQPAPIVYGTRLGGAQLDATANVPGSFAYAPPEGTLLEAGVETLRVHFTPADTHNYEHAGASVALEVQRATPVISWTAPAPIVYGTALDATQLDATADVAGMFTYTPPAGTILDAGNAQTLSVHFTPSDTRNYNDARASVKIDVAQAPQTLAWPAPAPIVYGTPLSATQLDANVTVVGPAAAGALVYAPPAGTVLDAGTHTLTVTAQETRNYLAASLSRTIEVKRAPLSLIVHPKSKLYGAAVPPLTGTLAGVVNGDAITPSYATTATQQSPAGTYPVTATLVDPSHRLANYDVTITPSTLQVVPAPLLISADPATKQYSDPLPQLTATFTGLVLGETPAVLGGTLLITTTATPLSAPGTYPIAIGGLTSPNYAITYAGSTLTVTAEDARVAITSPLLVTFSPNAPARVTLTAVLRDISATADANGDDAPGDIRNATLSFLDRADGTVLCSAPIGLVDADDARIAIATCTFTRTFASGTSSLTVGARAGGHYTRDAAADDVTLMLAPPTADSITGGGTTATGRFNVNLKYDKSGVAKGTLTFTFQRTQEGALRTFEISATSTDSLAIVRTANGGNAAIVGTATLRDITTPSAPVLVDAAAPFIVTAADDGEPSSRDSLSILLLKQNGGFWLASAWDGSRPGAQPVLTGNLQIHSAK